MDKGSDNDKSEQDISENETDSELHDDGTPSTSDGSYTDSDEYAAPPSARSKDNKRETNQPLQQELLSSIIQLCKQLSNDNLQTLRRDLFIMMKSQLSVRIVPPVPDRHIRIASWNLTDYNSSEVFWEKKHLVCETIKHYNFDIVALQEVGERDKESLANGPAAIVELKKELGEDWDIVRTEKKVGIIKQFMPVYGVFLYNKSRNITCTTKNGYLTPQTKLHKNSGRSPTLAEFAKKEKEVINISLLNFHLYSTKKAIRIKEIEAIPNLKIDGQREFLIILGDFNQYITSTCIESTKYQNILQEHEYTNTIGKQSYDGILVPQQFYNKTSNKWIVNKTYGVAEIAEKGDVKQHHVSDHKPIWADISIDDINVQQFKLKEAVLVRFDKSDPGRLPCVVMKINSTTQLYQLQ